MTEANARVILENLVRKSGLITADEKGKLKRNPVTKRLILHPHILIKFIRNYLGNSYFAEHLMGHASDMDTYYRNMKPEDIAAEYTKLIGNITIFSNSSDRSAINNEIIKLKIELSNKDRKIDELFEALVRLEKKR